VRCLTSLVFVVLLVVLAFAGYSYWQNNRMKGGLEAIKSKVVRPAGRPAGSRQDLLTALAEAKLHTTRARELLASGHAKRARFELDKSLRKLERASSLSQDIAADAGSGLGATWTAVRKEVEKAASEISRQIAKRRPEGNEAASGE